MKFQCINEHGGMEFDDAGIVSFKCEDKILEFVFQGAVIKAENSQNARFQDMVCGEIILQLKNAEIVRIVKEGMKYYDADGTLIREIPDEDIPAPAQGSMLRRISEGTVFTTVEDERQQGYALEFGIDVPREGEEEDVDTFWLCVTFDESVACWERYCSPAGEN